MTAAPVDPAAPCALCGLPCGRGGVRGRGERAERVYCCSGCARVDETIDRLPPAARAEVVREIARRMAARPEAPPPAVPDPMPVDERAQADERYRIAGLHCPSCSWLAEHTVGALPGVTEVRVDFLSEVASVRLDLRRTSRETVREAAAAAGYPLEPLGEIPAPADRLGLRLFLAAAVAMNVMMFAWIHYADLFGLGAGPWALWIGALEALLTLPVVAWAGLPILRGALHLLRRRRPGMDLLLAAGLLASTAYSFLGFVLPGAHFYFEIPCMIVATALGARAVERWIRRSGAARLHRLLTPGAVRVRRDAGGDEAAFVDIAALVPGDRIRIPAGGEVPVDLVVRGAEVAVSEATLTGEPLPIAKREGDTVLAGSRVAAGDLAGEVLRPADASALAEVGARVLAVLRGAEERTRAADRIAAWFVPAVLALAALTYLVRLLLLGLHPAAPDAWLPAVAVLVVACPCAFSLAASAAAASAVLGLLRRGLLVREVEALERAAEVDRAGFDKTGTLTGGEVEVRAVGWVDAPRPDLLPALRALEERSRHPVAAALVRHLAAAGIPAAPLDAAEELPGAGMRGAAGGTPLAVGAPRLFAPGSAEAPPPPGGTRVWFGRGHRPDGWFDLVDPLRPGAAPALAALAALGVEPHLLSGDAEETVARCAAAVGAAGHAGRLLPAQKAERIRAWRAEGRRVLFVGDGINDGPALAAADVGIALRHGAGLALESASVVALGDQPDAAVHLVRAARRLRRVTAQNHAWALGYNALLLPLAALGLLHPALAAVAMFFSSLTVLANSARLLRSAEPTTP